MDKDLIGNCSIIDILGAPDMDSCEYLSKHYGTQIIHKASDSDAKDYKGQSSRSGEVMKKSLLSADQSVTTIHHAEEISGCYDTGLESFRFFS
jgi:type IV secretion system protein VirD4